MKMKVFIDTNILVDLYTYFTNTISIANINIIIETYNLLKRNYEILISDIIHREFSLKVIDAIIKSKAPIPTKLGSKGLIEYADEIANDIINKIGAKQIKTDPQTLSDTQNIYQTLTSAGNIKKKLNAIARDLLLLIQATKSNAIFLTRDEHFIKTLKEIAQRNNWKINEEKLHGWPLIKIELRTKDPSGNEQSITTQILTPQQPSNNKAHETKQPTKS